MFLFPFSYGHITMYVLLQFNASDYPFGIFNQLLIQAPLDKRDVWASIMFIPEKQLVDVCLIGVYKQVSE